MLNACEVCKIVDANINIEKLKKLAEEERKNAERRKLREYTLEFCDNYLAPIFEKKVAESLSTSFCLGCFMENYNNLWKYIEPGEFNLIGETQYGNPLYERPINVTDNLDFDAIKEYFESYGFNVEWYPLEEKIITRYSSASRCLDYILTKTLYITVACPLES